ncbi:conserved hypothetical protein [uncultured Desulfobacterium sp.]|uniref:Cyclic GMP-AMP synthase n=1 Tax=uncultured Desulfobacterium sp. TaxID=201089 RepID=A0A445MT34_9BACT|nr:conserved hypothetical protein [uncultured Desulfobacterium sp.]
MRSAQELQLNEILSCIAESLDISPTDYDRAVQSYKAVGTWLEDGFENEAYPGSFAKPEIYPQGSIRIGTVVKPLRDSEDAAYDVDLVCELQYENIAWSSNNSEIVKQMVGGRLKTNGTYCNKLDGEGKRCWTLEYAKDNGVGFHIDVLPCVPDPIKGAEITQRNPGSPETQAEFTKTTIALTDKDDDRSPCYEWRSSNPNGYAEWFRKKNTSFAQFAIHQKQRIFNNTRFLGTQRPFYANVQEVPDQLVHTPLQRSIQILKRHRDIRFGYQGQKGSPFDPKFKPISMIITTLAATLYEGESDLLSALNNIVTKLSYHSVLVDNRYSQVHESVAHHKLIRRKGDGTWEIQNPVNPSENFAERWHEDEHARAKSFFMWVAQIRQDIQEALMASQGDLKEILGDRFGERTLNEAWKSYEKFLSSQAIGMVASAPRALARFNVPHRQAPLWPIQPRYAVNVNGFVSRNGFRPYQFNSDSQPLSKHSSLRFEAKTNTPWPYKVFWQVVNTDEEARAANSLRGGYYDGLIEKGGRVRNERTLYSGMHWVECFIVKNGVCVARSGEFVVNIQ